jgi:GntR family transcriptional regulator, transcriptional repressor for pyruvate dehydrogenase complex
MPGTTLKSIETRRLYQQVADQIRSVIETGAYRVGSRLPPERELALQLGVSRPSLREALIALEIGGRVEIRGGSGVYVCSPQKRVERSTPSLGESPSELMHARALVESSVVTLAAARVTRRGMERIRAALDAMQEDHLKGRTPLENDRRFHIAIAEMGGNTVLVRLVGELFDERHSPISARLSIRAESPLTWSEALSEHEHIYQALNARDPQSAAAAMTAHLRASQERWVNDSPDLVSTK